MSTPTTPTPGSLLDRVRDRFSEPNPLVRKELLALLRTPLYTRSLTVALIAVSLAVVAFALVASDDTSNTAQLGNTVFQIFFSLTFFVITVMGSTLGAVSVTQEREGRTLDGLVLSAMGPARLASGKLVAVLLATALVPAALLPVLGVAFMFGGVSLAHLLISAVYVFAFGSVAVAFGVAVSSLAGGTRQALVASVPFVTVGTLMLGGVLAAMGEVLERRVQLSMSGPLFFVDAYLAVPFGWFYVVALLVAPAYTVASLLSLAFSLARAGLTDENDDRAAPVKRWALWSVPAGLLVLRAVLAVTEAAELPRSRAALLAQCFFAVLGLVLAALFAGEPAWRTARMEHTPAGPLGKLTPPGSLAGLLFAPLVCGGASVLAPWLMLGVTSPTVSLVFRRTALTYGGVWVLGFLLVASGTMGALRYRRNEGATMSRVGLALFLLLVCVLVWIVALIAGVATDDGGNGLVALSPFYAGPAIADALEGTHWRGARLFWLVSSAGLYVVLGAALMLYSAGARRRLRERERARFAEAS